jgi:hypothetical protein
MDIDTFLRTGMRIGGCTLAVGLTVLGCRQGKESFLRGRRAEGIAISLSTLVLASLVGATWTIGTKDI